MAEGRTCPVCGAEDLASLAMVCPECNANLHNFQLKTKHKPRARLRVRLLYTGGNPDRMPLYGKLYINGKYCGNINMIEKQKTDDEFSQVWANGLGKDFTAYYEKIVENIPAGTLKVEVEMKFTRFYGFGTSLKRVVFPYTSFKGGEDTSLDHYFSSASTFHEHKPVKKQPIPIVSEAKLQGGDGNVALNVPLFR
jgi:hypothetical protein